MGIYERHYIRRPPPQRGAYGRGGLSALRMLSVNTWLIAICVGVFVVDPMLGSRWVSMSPPEPTIPAQEWAASVRDVLIWTTVVFTAISGFAYVDRGRRLLQLESE